MTPGINNEETRLYGVSSLKELGRSYKDIGQALLEVLRGENEPLEDFLTDWEDYTLCLIYDIDLETKLSWCPIQATPEFKQILKVAHSFTLECQRSRYIETGIDYHMSLTISKFLAEIFKRYHCSINSGTN